VTDLIRAWRLFSNREDFSMRSFRIVPVLAGCVSAAMFIAGCSQNPSSSGGQPPTGSPRPDTVAGGKTDEADAEIQEERAKLSEEDRALVEAQEWCVIPSDERLGSMGPPVKLTIKGKPVFICCKGCKSKAEKDPDQTLAKVEELKAKKKAMQKSK
jgi:hypothetical protein